MIDYHNCLPGCIGFRRRYDGITMTVAEAEHSYGSRLYEWLHREKMPGYQALGLEPIYEKVYSSDPALPINEAS